MESIDTIIIIVVVVVIVVSPFSLLCCDVVDRQMVLRASENGVLFDCPKIRFSAFSVTTPHRQKTGLTRNNTNDPNKASKLCVVIGVGLMVATTMKHNTKP